MAHITNKGSIDRLSTKALETIMIRQNRLRLEVVMIFSNNTHHEDHF